MFALRGCKTGAATYDGRDLGVTLRRAIPRIWGLRHIGK